MGLVPDAFTLLVSGFSVGFLIGLTSMGGATLMTGFLILIFGVHPHSAVGTDLVYASLTKIVGAYLHWRQGLVDLHSVRRLALGSLPAGLAGALAVCHIGRLTPQADRVLRDAIGVAVAGVAITLALGWHRRRASAAVWSSKQGQRRATTAWGGLIGGVVGVTSIGSGTLVLPYLAWAYDLPAARLVGTDIFHAAILLSVTGGLFAGAGHVEWALLPWLLAGSMPGIALGSRLAPRLPDRALRGTLMAVLLASAWMLIR
jgi:uncharacterized protein